MRPSIYIGLGGTGIRILAAIKKQYEDVYGKGNIPPIVNFLAIDFNLADINNPELPTSLEEDALLIPYVGDPRKHLEARVEQGDYKWMFPGNTCSIFGRLASSPDQLRTTGRFYTEYLLPYIQTALQQRVQQVQQIAFAPEFDLYILTSLCGGTGAGSFINIAELARRLYGKRCNIIGYGVLHNIFQTRDPLGTKTQKLPINTYSTIKDLDYLMSATPSKPIKFTINGQERVLSSPPFDLFYVVDNKTDNGQTVTNIQELCTYVGLHIYTRSQIPLPGINPQEMVVLHTWEAVIPYCIEAFDEQVVEEYERVIEAYLSGGSTFNPHVDKELFDQMCQEGFSLKPRSASEEPEQ